MTVHFDENNSGGGWWLDDKQYQDLREAGWEVGDHSAHKDFDSLEDGVREWEELTGADSEERGCECCGRPYGFWV